MNIHILLSYKVFSITSLLMALPQLFSLSCKSYWTFGGEGWYAFNGGKYKNLILFFFQERLIGAPTVAVGKENKQQAPLLTMGELVPYTGWRRCLGVRLEKRFEWLAQQTLYSTLLLPPAPCYWSRFLKMAVFFLDLFLNFLSRICPNCASMQLFLWRSWALLWKNLPIFCMVKENPHYELLEEGKNKARNSAPSV